MKAQGHLEKMPKRSGCPPLIWAVVLVGCLCSPAVPAESRDPGFSEQAVISRILFETIDPPSTDTDWSAMARSLITLSAGDRFSADGLEQSIEALRQSNLFAKIHVDAEEAAQEITLFFQLSPFRRIKEIKVRGAYPLFQRKVLSAMTIFPGDTYARDEIARQQSAVETLYRRQGYIRPRVKVSARQEPHDGNLLVTVDIDKGPYYRLEQLTLSGNRAFSDNRLKMKMSAWRESKIPGSSGRFVEKDFQDDLKNLIGFYRAKGYAEAAIEHRLEKNAGSGRVSAAVSISEGPLYAVEFKGNENLSNRALKKELVLASEGNRNDRGLKKSLRKLRALYRRKGFANAVLRTEVREENNSGAPLKRVAFIVEEGPRAIVASLAITGNRALSARQIEKQILTDTPGIFASGAFRQETLAQDRRAVTALYRQNGYLDADVQSEVTPTGEKGKVAVTISVEENRQTRVGSLRFEGLAGISEETAREAVSLKPGEPFWQRRMQDDEKTISALVSEMGFPFVTTNADAVFSSDRLAADIVYRIDPGPSTSLGDIFLTGNFRTRETVIRNELDIRSGDPFAPKRILAAQKSLRDMGIFNGVRLRSIGLREKRQSVDLVVEVEERKPYYVELGAGYESDRGAFANGAVGDINFLGTNKKLWLTGQISEIGYRADAGLAEPRLLGSRVSSALQLFAERREEFNKTFGTRRYGASLTFQRKWWEKLTGSLKFEFDQRDQFPTATSAENDLKDDTDEFRSRSVVSVTPGVIYDTRDSFIRPKRGFYSALSADISKGLRDDLDSFVRYRADLRYFHTPWERVTFAALGRAGYIDPYGDELKVPDDQLFYLGGIENVRGYDENLLAYDDQGDPLGGRTSLVLSLESRIDLGRNFELTLFYDIGRLSDTYSPNYDESFRSSVGLGLRYITPIGPMGLLYGHKINPREGESDGRWHLSIGYTF